MKTTTAFGAFVEIMPGTEGLVHISELQHGRTEKTEDVVKKGDRVKVKLIDRDERGRLRLSMKALRAAAGRHAGGGAASRGGDERSRRRRASAARRRRVGGGVAAAVAGAAESARAAEWRRGDARDGRRSRRTVLPNGLTVLSEHMPGVRSVAFGAWVRAASLHEPRERMGVSHLLEHMVFKGTRAPLARKQIALELEALGGSLDAYTSREHTVYQARVLDEHLHEAADVIGDIVFRPLAARQSISRSSGRSCSRRSAMVDDTPDDLVFELHNEALWGAHPYGYSILGTRDTVRHARRRATSKELHERAYHPAQLVVAAAGNVEHDALLDVARANRLDRRVPRGDATRLSSPPPRRRSRRRARHVEREGAQTHIVARHARRARTAIRAATRCVLLSMLLGGGMSSRLFQRVREELGLAYSVYTFQSFHADVGMHGVYVGDGAGDGARGARRDPRRARDGRRATGCPTSEIAMGKSQLKGQITLSLESVGVAHVSRGGGRALRRAVSHARRDARARSTRSRRTTSPSVAREFFAPERQTVVSLGPRARIELERRCCPTDDRDARYSVAHTLSDRRHCSP